MNEKFNQNKEIILYRNKNAWLNKRLHDDFIGDFCDKIAEKYPGKKCLLLLDNFSGHKISYGQYGNLEVRFFRPNMTPFIQPLDMAFFSIVKEKFKKWRRAWKTEFDSEPAKWLVLKKIFYFLNHVPHDHITGLWVTAKLIEPTGGEEEQAVLREQEVLQEEYDVQNIQDSLPPPNVEPGLDLPQEVVTMVSPVVPVPLPRPQFLTPSPAAPTRNLVTVPNYSPVIIQITPQRPVSKSARILF